MLDCKRLMERDLNVAKFELLEGELKAKGSEFGVFLSARLMNGNKVRQTSL
jgi:hypothetical protein